MTVSVFDTGVVFLFQHKCMQPVIRHVRPIIKGSAESGFMSTK